MLQRRRRDRQNRQPKSRNRQFAKAGRMPRIRFSEDEQLLARADRMTRYRLRLIQLLPISLLMLIPLGIFVFTSNKAILMVMILVLLTVYAPMVSLVGVAVSKRLGDHDVNLRRTYARLRSRPQVASSPPSLRSQGE